MNTRQKLHQPRFQGWAIRFTEQKASGLTVRLWCEQSDNANISNEGYPYIIGAILLEPHSGHTTINLPHFCDQVTYIEQRSKIQEGHL